MLRLTGAKQWPGSCWYQASSEGKLFLPYTITLKMESL